MFIPLVSFFINFATALLLFLVSIANLHSARFFTAFHFLKVHYIDGAGPQSGWLDRPYDLLSFGLWGFCEGTNNVVSACTNGHIGYTLESIPNVYEVDQRHIPNAVRGFSKVIVLYIPATCVAFLALFFSFIALFPRFRKRFLYGVSAFLSLLVTLSCVLLMVVVFTVFVSRKIQFERHLEPKANVTLGPGVWITLALVPLTIFGSLIGAFAVCCPGRFKKQSEDAPESKEEAHEPTE
ncbi:hypothetical protein BG011_004077 [Mortierella polycephala]|uniref:SUR7/PalI family-domain-containing protein n=1 Tax=Mortierella polycephala TaxID=41804 RepID=A0A9P6Q2I7_9FUNG|nr:hypothetical protein BG011_004077 [Mortierella polycephala]